MFGRDLGTSQAIKKVEVCIHYDARLRLVLSSQGLIDYMSNDCRGCTVDVWRSSDLIDSIRRDGELFSELQVH